ncbi:calcium-dependent phosphotriesterase [Rhizophagus clarus]|uniref:Calcium-dependent phosphotriesterase n=1 Tax=Rhizophagus clarus TaxID=94130 RepID=A0A8H3QDR1_9GLOM|nr:calcium-dependent phosphotriesterase [Rhizophagus clarus]
MANISVYDNNFLNIIDANATPEILATADYNFAHEAGVYVMDSNEVYFTSNRLGDTSTADQHVEINKINLSTKKVSNVNPERSILLANGGTYNSGQVIICSQGQRDIGGSIVSLDPNSNKVTTIVDSYFGLKFNSPNDIVVSKDGCYWFTDPSYGYEQNFRDEPQLGNYVYRFDPSTNNIRVVADGFIKPNGIAFSPDERILYITDTGYIGFVNGNINFDPMKPRTIYAYDVDGSVLSNRRVFAVIDVGVPDGIKTDVKGVANFVFAGEGLKTLVMFAEKIIYSINLKVGGALISKYKAEDVLLLDKAAYHAT